MQERHIEHKNYINTYVARFLNLLHLALALNSLTIWPFSFDHIGLGVLVYQLTIYPFLAKYAGLIKPFRSAAVCAKNTFYVDIFLWYSESILHYQIACLIFQVLSILLLATYPFMANLYGMELKVLINIASLLKNVFAVSPLLWLEQNCQRFYYFLLLRLKWVTSTY
jgi:hypothetical protein